MKPRPRTTEELIVALWQCGESEHAISRQLGSVDWSPSGVRLLVRQLRLLGVPLRPAVTRGEHELELEALAKRVDLGRLTEIAVAAGELSR